MAQLREVFRVLSESIAARLREQNLKGRTISIWLRDTDLKGKGCQGKFLQHTDLARDILEMAMQLAAKLWSGDVPLRSVGIRVENLSDRADYDQLDLFSDPDDRAKERKLETVLHEIRKQYGYDACRMASSQVDAEVTDFDPLGLLHQVHPIGALDGPIRL